MTDGARLGEEIIQHHSKSFALASRLLPAGVRSDAVAVYAWCRRADDAIDLAEPDVIDDALTALDEELANVYAGEDLEDPVLRIFQRTAAGCAIPIEYPRDLLAGMAMDVADRRYDSMADLLDYCYHVAGCVGLMMCHVMGVRDDAALANAAHLGIAMQLTNICRDVEEDWERDRLYLPAELLDEAGAPRLVDRLGGPFPEEARVPASRVIARLLDEADRFYASGDAGLTSLSWRCAVAIRTARVVYSSIGERIHAQGCDPLAGRAYTSSGEKVKLAMASTATAVVEWPRWAKADARGRIGSPGRVVRFPTDILPVDALGVGSAGARA